VRAYGGTLNNALEVLKTTLKVPATELIGRSDYALQGVIEQYLNTHFTILQLDKSYDSAVNWQVSIDSRQVAQAQQEIFDLTHGVVELVCKE
jgi:putative IMPACT (imprinted ancient) family translation regulator